MEKLLVTSNFSFSHNVSNSYISLVRQNAVLCANGLIMYVVLGQEENLLSNTVKSFCPCLPVLTAQADVGRYISLIHLAPCPSEYGPYVFVYNIHYLYRKLEGCPGSTH